MRIFTSIEQSLAATPLLSDQVDNRGEIVTQRQRLRLGHKRVGCTFESSIGSSADGNCLLRWESWPTHLSDLSVAGGSNGKTLLAGIALMATFRAADRSDFGWVG
jgi:hypothetical protein